MSSNTFFHVHLVSDSTGETLSTILKATSVRFKHAKPLEHVSPLIRSKKQLDKTLARVEGSPGIVLYTIADQELLRHLKVKCAELQVPAYPVLDPILQSFSSYLGVQENINAGGQHKMDEEYFKRISAIDYTLAHDDGQQLWDLESADIVLLGVSRTSKTPTCMYLANRGYRAANVPLVPSQGFPAEILNLKKPFVIGLTASATRLSDIRQNRLKNLDMDMQEGYADLDHVKNEILLAKRLYTKNRWPIIDVTKRSVEETAALIIAKYTAHKQRAQAAS